MDDHPADRRSFLKKAAALSIAAPAVGKLAAAHAKTMSYDPAAKFEVKISETEFRRTAAGRQLMARIYQPQGAGPFPTLLDLHGGAWNNKDRFAEEPMDRAVAASGVLVVAIDMTLAPEAPYPASVQDANYGVRWLKAEAAELERRPVDGRRARQLQRRPRRRAARHAPARPALQRDSRCPTAPNVDATVAYVATRSPISDPYARYQQAEKMKREGMIKNNKTYFNPWETIFEANPQQILERREAVTLPPMLIMQGALDDNVLPALQEKFAATYQAAGGDCQLQVFEGCEHEWVAKPGPQTDRAHEMVKAFIAEHVAAGRRAG